MWPFPERDQHDVRHTRALYTHDKLSSTRVPDNLRCTYLCMYRMRMESVVLRSDGYMTYL